MMTRPRGTSVVVVALLVLLLAELGVRGVEADLAPPPEWPNPFADVKTRQMDELGTADTILVGSSIVNAGLDPDLVADAWGVGEDHRVYNAALPSAPVEQWPLWYLDVVVPRLHPRCAVIGISVRDWNATNVRPDLVEQMATSEGYQRAVGSADWLSRIDATVSERSQLVRYRAVLRQPGSALRWARGERVPGWPRRDVDADGRYRGFDDRQYRHLQDRLDRLRAGAMADYRPGGSKVDKLAVLLDGLVEREVHPVLVHVPSMHRAMVDGDLLTEADVAAVPEQLAELADVHGADLVVGSDLADGAQAFSDLYHFNRSGSRRISTWVGKALVDTGCGV